MSLTLDPRGDLIIPNIKPTMAYRPLDSTRDNRRSLPASFGAAVHHGKHKFRRPCYDWIFSTASNVHVAIDRASFKTYNTFKSYVLAVSDHRQIPVLGVGSVEINLRRSPNSNESHKVVLDNALHIPSWLCNIFSDIYFPGRPFDHAWTDQGLQLMERSDVGSLQSWGYTTDFFGLDRLSVIAGHKGRSPMAEDKDREIFSVNLMWPQRQRDLWDMQVSRK